MVFQAHPGDILAGKYRVDRVLGIGGMGMVVAATHLELDQAVALKFMLGDMANSPSLLDRFIREARAVVKLRGEHVCRISDVGRLDNGAPYIVMELLAGEDFAAMLSREGKLEPHVAVSYLLQAIEGVAEAHAEGIIHRDLKPGNLFITTRRDGTPLVKVLDFGISKSSSAPATRTGDILGSPGYMAPEQMSNAKSSDARTDVWALGVILYQALAARMPWTGDSLPALCMSVISDPAPPLPDDIAPELAAVVMRCLEKEKDARWPDVGELALALAPFGDAEATKAATRISRIVSAMIPSAAASAPTLAAVNKTPTPKPPVDDLSERATIPSKPRTGPPTPTPAPLQPISTISSSAAEIALPPPRSNKLLFAGLGGALAAGAVAFAVVSSRGSSEPAPVAVAPTPAPNPAPAPPPDKPAPPPETPLAIGKRVFEASCNSCHSADGTQRTGPTFAKAWGSTVILADGTRVGYDEAYFRESLAQPNAKLHVGYPAVQPTFDKLTEAEIGGLIAYTRSLAGLPLAQAACELPGKLDTSGKQAGEYRCSKIDFKTKACQCPVGTFAMRTADNIAVCHEVPAGCPAPVAEPVASTTSRPVAKPTTTTTTTTTPPKPDAKPDPKPDELWMQMTHDNNKKKP